MIGFSEEDGEPWSKPDSLLPRVQRNILRERCRQTFGTGPWPKT